MRGASAASFATLTDALDSALHPSMLRRLAGRGGVDPAVVADDLFAVAAVLNATPALRRVLTDPSVPGEAKADLANRLFEGRVGDTALDLVKRAVSQRWAGTRHLGDALEQLGVRALVAGAEDADEGDRLENDLFNLGRLIEDNPELRDALSDPARNREDKSRLLHGLLEGRVSPVALRLAEQAVSGTHRTVAVAVTAYQRAAAAYRERALATVRVARPLSDEERSRLQAVLTRQYSKAVHLNVLVDPSVLGGVRVEIGDEVIDGTVASRLDDARRRLAG